MADTKISALPVHTTPADTDMVPVVVSGVNKQIARSALVAPKDPASGDLILNIIPRTDTEANLLALAGGQGEIGSSTDTKSIVKFSGNVGGAVTLTPFKNTLVLTPTTDNQNFGTIQPNYAQIVIANSGYINTQFTLANGYFIGHEIEVASHNTGSETYGLPGVLWPQIKSGHICRYRWTGAAWDGVDDRKILPNAAGAVGSEAYCAWGADAASGAYSLAVGRGALALSVSGVAIGDGSAVAPGALGSTVIGKGRIGWNPATVMLGSGIIGYGHSVSFLYASTTDAATAVVMTTDGAAAGAANGFGIMGGTASADTGVVVARITVVGKDTLAAAVARFTRELTMYVDGAAYVIADTKTPIADFASASLAGVTIAISTDAVTGQLRIALNGIAGKTIHWGARIESFEVLV